MENLRELLCMDIGSLSLRNYGITMGPVGGLSLPVHEFIEGPASSTYLPKNKLNTNLLQMNEMNWSIKSAFAANELNSHKITVRTKFWDAQSKA